MPKIDEILRKGRSFSFEFFPPRDEKAEAVLAQTLRELEPLHPSYVSVTYGAGGTTRERTHDLVEKAVLSVVNLTHRGAVSADGKSGDGAGILSQIPRRLFNRTPPQQFGDSDLPEPTLGLLTFGANSDHATLEQMVQPQRSQRAQRVKAHASCPAVRSVPSVAAVPKLYVSI